MTAPARKTMKRTVFSVPETIPVKPKTTNKTRNATAAAAADITMPLGIQFL
jgi:hypothetical protein